MFSKSEFDDATIERFLQLISSQTGWYIRNQDRDSVCQKISTRVKILKLNKLDDYYQLLKRDTTESEKEWQELAGLLTIPESYLFRDRGQFSLLEKTILPELIESRKHLKRLRIWSAGCSTGEEAYSLAILVEKLIPNLKEWDILILGTDINPVVIEKAKQGIYNSWSFRLIDSELQKQYFSRLKAEWQLNSKIRNMVTFRGGNLTKDPFPNFNLDIHSMDLILCRNVFLYFEAKAISAVIEKFYNTLSVGGYFMSGHAELYGQNIGIFKARLFPESIIYSREEKTISNNQDYIFSITKEQKEIEQYPKIGSSSNLVTNQQTQGLDYAAKETIVPTRLATLNTSNQILIEAQQLFASKKYSEAIKKTEQLLIQQPKSFDAHYLMAQVYANLGDYNNAIHYCQIAVQLDSLSISPYYLLMQIAEEQGEIEKAKKFLKKIIYLEPSAIYAYLELAFLYEQENHPAKAKKMRAVALQILDQLPSTAIVQLHPEIKAGELIPKIKQMLNLE